MSIETWSTLQVSDWVTSLGLSQYSQIFQENKIDGILLSTASHEMLREMAIEHQERSLILNSVYKVKKQSGFDMDFEPVI